MILTNEEAEQFYDLWIPLLDFVNQKYKHMQRKNAICTPNEDE